MIILLTVVIILIVLLAYSIDIVYEISLENFKFSAKVKVRFPFTRELYNSKKKKALKESGEKAGNKRKINLNTIKKLKKPVTDLLADICFLIKKHCKVVKIETTVKTALEDPMKNGIAYGILSGSLNAFTLILREKCKVKNPGLDIQSNFDSGEGLILKNTGTLRVRLIPLVIDVFLKRKVIENIKDIRSILDITNKEEDKNG